MKKLLIFLMIAIPLVIIVVLNFTVNTVTGFVPVPVDSITLNAETSSGKVGESFSLNASFVPENASNKNLSWKSDNESVATVDNKGTVIFVGYGKCYITATSEDGNKKASCYFYVYDTVAHDLDFIRQKKWLMLAKHWHFKQPFFQLKRTTKKLNTNLMTKALRQYLKMAF